MTNNIVIPETVEEVPLETIRVIEGEEEIRISHPGYLFDESKISGGHAEKIFFPKNEQEVATIIKKLNEEKIPVTISAARTGIVGSAVPLYGGVIISFEQLNSVKGIGYDEEEKRWFAKRIGLRNLKN